MPVFYIFEEGVKKSPSLRVVEGYITVSLLLKKKIRCP